MASLFHPFDLSGLQLTNRMVMAPMTRNRADKNGVVTPIMVTHYQQRASAGLIIAESSPVSTQGIGYPYTPGIYTTEQVDSWKKLTHAVHQADGKIYIQLQHCGRISHPTLQPSGEVPVSASAIKPTGQAVTYEGKKDFVYPRALETCEIPEVVEQFGFAAQMAKEAGFDGVEVHGANGYLIDQFLRDGTNQRNDVYGGNIESRMRLLNEVIDSILETWPSNRIGIRLTPENSFNSMYDSNPQENFEYVLQQLNYRNISYVHILEGDMIKNKRTLNYQALRESFKGVYIANNSYNLERAQKSLKNNSADLIAFGTPFLANPDLVYRLKKGIPLNQADHSTFYGGNEKGYTDYPFFATQV
ncbi:alkene reductase [Microbulbifer sp. JMSA004]|uniref:alkene reductase n=1 Tax=unclassified Microbulbifer TaxID=2619833 RepID=UPI0024ADF106|nr:alkene reductase [Microbulbifer sp. VAAF005]WHI46457.1 alkene reductase [Microbulbifer sp. VAAF005]